MSLPRIWIGLLLMFPVTLAASQWRDRIDLQTLLRDDAALQRFTIRYTTADKPGQVFYIHGDGNLVLQQLPRQNDVWMTLVPTCKAQVEESVVQKLVAKFVDDRFFDLPYKNFVFVYVSDDPEKAVHVHTIIVDSGTERAARSFATGTYRNEVQTIPPPFAAIESAIQDLRDNAFPTTKPCSVAPPVRF